MQIASEKKEAIVAELKALGNENEYQSDYERVMARYVARIHNPMSAIRAKCVQCCLGQPGEVAKCTVTQCALHPFRMGTNPHNKRVRERLGLVVEDQGEDSGDDDANDTEAEL